MNYSSLLNEVRTEYQNKVATAKQEMLDTLKCIAEEMQKDEVLKELCTTALIKLYFSPTNISFIVNESIYVRFTDPNYEDTINNGYVSIPLDVIL